LFEQLSDEQTPKLKEKFNGSDTSKSVQQLCADWQRLHPSIIDQIFGGMMKTIVTCRKCQHPSLTFNPFMTQSLSCKSTLTKSLHDVFDEHQIDGNYLCEKCKKPSKASVKHEIVLLPKVLIFHLKRFDAEFHKIKTSCEFDPLLDMSE
jgi:ubiquitin carboxyl-terminal hydrolase 36/42